MGFKKLLSIGKAIAAALICTALVFSDMRTADAATTISIKSIYNGSTYTINNRFKGYTIKNGVDVSKWQGEIDWNGLKSSGTQFAFIRLGYRSSSSSGAIYLDEYFTKNIAAANASSIPVGVYFYSQAITEAEARAEANYCIKQLSGKNIDLPIVMDFEYSWINGAHGGRLYDANLSKAKATSVINAFLDTVRAAGYDAMVYGSKNTLLNSMDMSKIENNNYVWLAHYTYETDYSGKYQFWQYSSKGKSKYVSSDDLDCDFWFLPNELTALSFTESSRNLTVGESFQPELAETPAYNSDTVTLSTSDPDVAAIIDGRVYGVSAGEATITAKSSGGITAVCKITVKRSLSGFSASQPEDSIYDGQGKTPNIELYQEKPESGTLVSDADVYKLPSDGSGTVSKAFAGAGLTIRSYTADGVNGFLMCELEDGTKGYIRSELIQIDSFETEKLTAGVDYTVVYSDNISAGTATATATAVREDLTGEKVISFTILPKDISECSFAKISDQLYCAASVTPDAEVSDGEMRLANGTDYSLEYSDNIKVGTASMTVTGLGNYCGQVQLSFAIIPRPPMFIPQSAYSTSSDGETAALTVLDDGQPDLSSLADGEYRLVLSAEGCASKELRITVTGGKSDAYIDIELFPIGDVNGDGKVNAKDYNLLYEHMNRTNPLSDYAFSCADVNGDGKVNAKDYNRIYEHMNKTNPL